MVVVVGRSLHLWIDGGEGEVGGGRACCGCRFARVGSGRALLMAIISLYCICCMTIFVASIIVL